MRTSKSVPLPLRPQRKKDGPSWVHVELSHSLCECCVPKIVCHHFVSVNTLSPIVPYCNGCPLQDLRLKNQQKIDKNNNATRQWLSRYNATKGKKTSFYSNDSCVAILFFFKNKSFQKKKKQQKKGEKIVEGAYLLTSSLVAPFLITPNSSLNDGGLHNKRKGKDGK